MSTIRLDRLILSKQSKALPAFYSRRAFLSAMLFRLQAFDGFQISGEGFIVGF